MSRIVLSVLLSLSALSLTAASDDASPRTEDFSLNLDTQGKTKLGYFPLGFVRGEPALTVPLGANQVQDTGMFPGFAEGEAYPAPSVYLQDPWNLRYYSLALPADGIQSLLVQSARAGKGVTTPTKRFGAFTLATGPDGKPYALPEYKTRDLAKIRDLVDIFDPATRRYLQAYVKAHVESRAELPVNFWGLDNEWEAPPNYSPVARGLFLEWLKRVYAGDIAALNAAWRTGFKTFDQKVVADLPAPADYRARPGAFLDWYEFSTDYFLHVMLEQVRTMHEADPRKRGVVNKSTQLTLEMPATSRLRLFNHGRFADLVRPYSGGYYGVDMYGAGDRQAYETSYIFNCIRPLDRAPGYGVMLGETNNHNGPGHQFASTAWRLLANGAKGVMLFTPGFVGAPVGSDWSTFALIDRDTGRPKDKWFYAARWTAAVHRTERFWTEAAPAPGLPRLAMLVPRRDILLSEPSDRNPAEGRFAYPRNHRWMVYRWLREQGYWVDVLPYEKFADDYLRDYAGLVLVGAEHLTATECQTVARYVAAGGVLVADTQPGYFDQHHRLLQAFAKPAGLTLQRSDQLAPVAFETAGHRVEGVTAYRVDSSGARALVRDAAGQPLALLQAFHDGRILSLPFELGSLRLGRQGGGTSSVQSAHEPTAGTEQYDAHPGEFVIGTWLASLLSQAGLSPSYVAAYPEANTARIVRIEQPSIDAAGNVAIVIGNRAQLNPQERLPAGRVELPLPGGRWTTGWWAPAEDERLVPVSLEPLDGGRHRVDLPAIPSSGILYLFKAYNPLIGLVAGDTGARAVDGLTPRVKPGQAVRLSAQLVNTTGAALGAGAFHVQAPAGWSVEPASLPTPLLAAGAEATVEITVTAAPTLPADRLQPVIVRWRDASGDRAIMTKQLEGAPDDVDIPRLLTANTNYPATFPYRVEPGATYRYATPASGRIADPAEIGGRVAAGQALLSGFGSIGGERNSFNRGEYVKNHYARFAAPAVEIVFDLQARRELARVNVVCGPEPVVLTRLQVLTSDDGETFVPQGEVAPARPLQEIAVSLARVPARYVKLRAEWPAAGGTLDEVELWGW